MNLAVTPGLVRELARHPGHGDKVGIVLGPDGWEVRGGVTHGHPLVALTKESVFAYLGSDDPNDLDGASAEALTDPAAYGRTDFAVRDEDGGPVDPDAADVQVVTHRWLGDALLGQDAPAAWAGAWAFDLDRAALVLAEEARTGTGHVFTELWRTAGGQYVQRTRGERAGGSEHWTETGLDRAVRLAYDTGAARLADDVPAVVRAARHARAIVDLLAPPRPSGDGETDRDAGTGHVGTVRALGDLLRTVVTADLRAHRADAARMVVATFGGHQQNAASHISRTLGISMSKQTLGDLLNS